MEELIAELKAKRESLGLTVQDLFQRTRINTEFLEALESGNFDVLPEAYVKLFLKRYAQEVKLDGDEIVKRFEQHQWKQKATTESIQRSEPAGTPGWVIGAGGAAAIAIIAAIVIWQSTPTTTSTSATSTTQRQTVVATPRPPVKTTPPPVASTVAARRDDAPITTPPIESDPGPDPVSVDADITPTEPESTPVPATPSPASPRVESDPSPSSASPPPADTAIDPVDPPEETRTPPPSTTRPVSTTVVDAPAPEDQPETERVVSAYSISLKQDLSASVGGLKLTAVGLEPTDVIVTTDGEPVYEGLIDAGRRVTWEAADRFSVDIQKGSGLRLQLQDEILPVVGAEGRQVRLYISRFSIWVEEIESINPVPADTTTP